VPVAIIKRYEFRASKSCDRLSAPTTLLGEQVTETLSAVRLLIARRELLSSQYFVTVGTGETLSMPRCVLVRDASLIYHSVALHTALGVLFFVTLHAYNLLITWDKALVSDWLQANLATEALFVPLLAFVLILLHPRPEQTTASITSCCEVVVVAFSTVNLLSLAGERVIHKRDLTIATLEAFLMPMPILVR